MKKILSYFISALAMLVVIGIVNGIINYFFLWENSGEKYFKQYIMNCKQIKVRVDEKYFEGKISHTSYLKYTIGFKGITGGSEDYIFKDSYAHKYYKIMRFDLLDQSISAVESMVISGKELYVIIDPYEYNNPAYGTLAKPIHVFCYKGVEKSLGVSVGAEGWQNIEPTQQEYEYNVINYLTYVMPKEEFAARFEKEK